MKDLFYNTPARYKFLKKDSTEAGYISDTIARIALGNPDISFKLTNGKTTLIHTPGNNDLKSVIYSIYGKEIIKDLVAVEYADEKIKISGYVGKPEAARSNRNYQSLYINKRYVKSRLVSYSVEQAFSSILMKNRFPFFVLNIDINPILVDANVHPAKTEVRFADESYLSRTIYMAVSNAITTGGSLFNPVEVPIKDRELFKFTGNSQPKNEYVQKEIEISKKQNDNKKAEEIRLFTKALEPLAKCDVHKVSTFTEKPQTDMSSFTFTKSEDYNVNLPQTVSNEVKQENTIKTDNNFNVIKEADYSKDVEEDLNEDNREANTEKVHPELADMKYIARPFLHILFYRVMMSW
ncbi:DNA mismatch repair endonuclease MutL [Ruminiclostridium josui]|uniref:DNA mismatch repair endonuclease MutL n=1 Tax=Ruminiclostridium josui TaxID=1499 RepID=UPI003BF4D97D